MCKEKPPHVQACAKTRLSTCVGLWGMESLAHVSPRVRARVARARGAQTSSAAARPFKVTVTPQRRGWRKHEIGQIKNICENQNRDKSAAHCPRSLLMNTDFFGQ